ncbi:MAG: hypothetical protein LBF83_06630 [Spirochaetaceae bacterium]|nr:hypothetical protein [Spirochaetaceae bacterium]
MDAAISGRRRDGSPKQDVEGCSLVPPNPPETFPAVFFPAGTFPDMSAKLSLMSAKLPGVSAKLPGVSANPL